MGNYIGYYIVQNGDSLYEICQKLKINFNKVKELNHHIINYNLIFPGDLINVEFFDVDTYSQADFKIIHKVKKDETLNRIAQKYAYTLEALLRCNPQIKNPELINVDDQINIYLDCVYRRMSECCVDYRPVGIYVINRENIPDEYKNWDFHP